MTEPTKACIACAEEIKAEALLCKHCKTRQDDPQYLIARSTETETSGQVSKQPVPPSIDRHLFASAAAALCILDDLDIFTFWKDDEVVRFSCVVNNEDFFLDEDLLKFDSLLDELTQMGLVENEWSSIELDFDEEEEAEEDDQFTWHFELPLIDKLKDAKYVDATLESLKSDLVIDRSFEDRANALIVYCLERVKSLSNCNHVFKKTQDLHEKCKKCGGLVYSPDEYIELFG